MAEKSLQSSLVYDGNFLKVWRDEVELQDHSTSYREYIKHPGASVIIALDDNKDLLFVRQFRFPLKKYFLELPAGKKDPGESPVATAQRELEEETGYVAHHCEHLANLHPCIGYADEVIHLVLATNLKFVGVKQEADEFLEPCKLSLDQAMEKIKSGEITDGKTIFGVMWYFNFGRTHSAEAK